MGGSEIVYVESVWCHPEATAIVIEGYNELVQTGIVRAGLPNFDLMDRALVVVEGGELLGVLVFRDKSISEGRRWEVTLLFVETSSRHQGYAYQLIDDLKYRASKAGVSGIDLTFDGNSVGWGRILEKVGFAPTKITYSLKT